jgi:hypothetical protein
MIDQHYPYVAVKDNTHYIFESVGEKGSILKAVVFTQITKNTWNLGFGDLKNQHIDDSIITNNQDAAKVIRTVAKIAFVFLVRNPKSVIVIKPVDEKRKKLYNSIFQRYFSEIEPIFDVCGVLGKKQEVYSPLKRYDRFKITFKF